MRVSGEDKWNGVVYSGLSKYYYAIWCGLSKEQVVQPQLPTIQTLQNLTAAQKVYEANVKMRSVYANFLSYGF